MATLLGLMLGTGLVIIWWSCWPRMKSNWLTQRSDRLADTLRMAGFGALQPKVFILLMLGLWIIIALVLIIISASVVIGLCVASVAVGAAWNSIGARARHRSQTRMKLWPEVVDQLRSAVSAGIGLPEALMSLAVRAPEELREDFEAFSMHYRAGQRFNESLNWLKKLLADPVADRIIETLRMTHTVGGSDMSRVLENLSWYLREDLRLRGELLARQSWTVNSAKLAVAAPWIVLILMSTRPGTAAAYSSGLGVTVLLCGVGVCGFAYWLMMKISHLPTDMRVLR